MNKVLTVVIPSYNVEKYIEKNINSYLDEEINDLIEILVVNDGSKDGTADIAGKYERRYPGTVRLISKENGGHGSTINTGIANAVGKYFRVVDGDDWCDRASFVRYVKTLVNLDSDVVLTPFNIVNVNSGEIQLKKIDYMESGQIYSFDDIILENDNFYQLHSVTVKTEHLKKMQPIDENCYYVDVEYTVFPVKELNTAVYLTETVYQYRIGDGEQSVSMKSKQKNRRMHYQVISTLIDFYKRSELSDNKKHFLAERIATMCNRQIEIYLSMKICSTTRNELLEFVKNVQQRVPEIYEIIPGKKAGWLRKTHYLLYVPFALFTIQKLK